MILGQKSQNPATKSDFHRRKLLGSWGGGRARRPPTVIGKCPWGQGVVKSPSHPTQGVRWVQTAPARAPGVWAKPESWPQSSKQERRSRPLSFSTFVKNGIISNIFCIGKLWKVLVVQLYLTFWDPMDCSLPGSSVHGILQARILERVSTPFSKEAFPTQGSNPGLPHCRQILYHLSQ